MLSKVVATCWLYFAQTLWRAGVRAKMAAPSRCYIRYTICGAKSRQGFAMPGVAEIEFPKKVLYFCRPEAIGAGKQGKNARREFGDLRLYNSRPVIGGVARNMAVGCMNWPGLIDTGARKGLI